MQAVLMRRKSELEAALHNARGTAFESPDTSQVSIGTIVTLRDSDTGKEEVYTVLGAWDGDPDRNIISYQTAIGQAMLGHKVGEIVTLSDETETRRFAIISIEPAPVDVTPPDPSLPEIPVEAASVE
jgi:transcription elongation GreA/GreB family factor